MSGGWLSRAVSHDLPRSRWLACLLVGLLLALVFTPFLFPGVKALNVAAKVLVFVVLVASFDLLLGYTGIVSFAHTMFFGIGAYGLAIAFSQLGPTWSALGIGLAAGLGLSGLLAWVIGLFSLRVRAIFFAMITLAVASAFQTLASKLSDFTGGEDGLQAVPRPRFFGVLDTESTLVFYYVCLLAIGFGFWLIYRTVHSPFGQVLRAIRDNEARAKSLGYQVNRYKLLAFVLSASLAGLAGAMKVLAFQLATLTDVSWTTSGEALLVSIVGGLNTMLGPIVGAVIMGSMEHYLASFAEWVLIIQGAVFVVVVMVFRKGVVGQLRNVLPWSVRSTPAKEST